jgi:hypothetical protein
VVISESIVIAVGGTDESTTALDWGTSVEVLVVAADSPTAVHDAAISKTALRPIPSVERCRTSLSSRHSASKRRRGHPIPSGNVGSVDPEELCN